MQKEIKAITVVDDSVKKLFFIFIMILTLSEVSASNIFPFKEVNKSWNAGLLGGYVGYGKDISNGAIGFSLTIRGFYTDYMGWYPTHEHDMGVGQWPGKQCTVVHTGYQIPIIKCLRFIPTIGYAKVAYGTTNGRDYTISDSGTVHNKFLEKEAVSGFDFGGIITINIKRLDINLALTKYAMFGGIAVEF